jgi:hypothetical protein
MATGERDTDDGVEWDVRERVHIMPVGYEHERIVQPAKRSRADRVILIGNEEDEEGDQGRERLKEVTEELEELNIPYHMTECRMFDLYSSLGAIAEAVSTHADDDVYVNVSTGSKITAIAGMIASMVMDSTAYYVRAKDYDGETPRNIIDVVNLPPFPIDAPDQEQVNIMALIETWAAHEGPPTKGEVIHVSEQEGMSYVRQNVAGKGKYRLLDTHIVEPLKQRGWIVEMKSGRNKVLELTDDGASALQAFRWMTEEIDWTKHLEELLEEDS